MRLIFFVLISICLCQCHQPRQHFSGYTDTLYVYLSSPSLGYVNEKLVERGQRVNQNQLLYRLSAAPNNFSVKASYDRYRQAQHTLRDFKQPRRPPEIMATADELNQAIAARDRVDLHLQRLLKLQKKQFIDQDTIDNQTQTLRELNFKVKQIQENLHLSKMGARKEQINAQVFAMKAAKQEWQQAKWYLQSKNIRAPNAGYVFDTFYSQGELVPAEKPVLVMVVPENHYIEFFVNSKQMASLSIGQNLTYQFYGNNRQYVANISYISATVEYMPPILYTPDYQEELVFRVRAKPKNSEHFILGQPIDVWL